MDIAQYLGKFLVKNNFCSIPGLGVLEVKKTIATYNTGTHEMSNPETYITFNPIGTIDDSFASFIANRENVSIANASNAIGNFAKNVKLEATRRGKYELDYIGDFTFVNERLVFKQSPEFNLGHASFQFKPLASESSLEQNTPVASTISKEYAGDSYASIAANKGKFNWSSVLFLTLLLGILVAGGYFGYNYYQNNKTEETKTIEDKNKIESATPLDAATEPATTTITPQDTSTQSTTTTQTGTTSSATATSPTATGGYKVAVLKFSDEATAKKKADKLKMFGNNTEVQNKDNSFVVVINATSIADTAHLCDSLRKLYNPKGPVYILQ